MGRRFLDNGVRVGLLSGDPEDGNDAVAAAEPAADSVETELLAVADASDKVEEQQAQIDDAAEAAEGLENLALEMRAAMESGGINRYHAATISRNARELLMKVGQDYHSASRVMPALESFGSASRAMESTSIGMETLAESAKNLWKKILEQLEKAWNYIRGHFLKLFGAFEKLKKRAEALAGKVEANTESNKEQTSLEREDIAKAVHIAGKVDVANLKPLADTAKEVANKWTESIGEAGEHMASYFSSLAGASTADEVSKAEEELKKVVLNAPLFGGKQANPADHGYEPRDGLTFYITGELPGGKAIYAYSASPDANGAAPTKRSPVAGQTVVVGNYKAKNAEKAPTKLPVLDKGTITAIGEQVSALCDDMIGYKRNENKFSTIQKKISDSAKKLANRAPKGDEPAEVTAALKEAGKLATKAPSWISGTAGSFYNTAATAAKGFLDWAELSLAQYKAK